MVQMLNVHPSLRIRHKARNIRQIEGLYLKMRSRMPCFWPKQHQAMIPTLLLCDPHMYTRDSLWYVFLIANFDYIANLIIVFTFVLFHVLLLHYQLNIEHNSHLKWIYLLLFENLSWCSMNILNCSCVIA